MKMIRWGALIPTVLIVAAIAVFAVFFMDGLVKRAIEKYGTAANGARVELDGVNISLRTLSVTLKHLQVTNADAPMTNSFEVDALTFDLSAKPLAWKKIVVEKAAVAGIRTDTPRKHSGALPAEELKKREEEEKKKSEEAQKPSAAMEKGKEAAQFALANLREQYDPQKMVQLENLSSYKKIQEEQTRLGEISKSWETRADAVNVDDKVNRIKDLVEKVKTTKFDGLEGIKKAGDTLKEATRVKNDLKETQKNLLELKDALKTEMAQAKESFKAIDELRKQDVENALGPLKAGFSTEGITKGLVGSEWNAKIQTYLGYFHKVRKMIPKKSAKEKAEEEKNKAARTRKGVDIPFPFRYAWPAFHLKLAALSGVTSGESPLAYEGTLKDVTSDPALVGRPIALDIAGKKKGGPEALTLRAVLDYTTDVPREKVSAKYEGIVLAGTKLGQVGGPVSIVQGQGVTTASVEVKGEALAGEIVFVADPVKLDQPPADKDNRLNVLLRDVLTKINKMDIAFLLSDTVLSPNIKIRTSLDDQISKAIKDTLQKQLDEIKDEVKDRINNLVNGEKQKLVDMVSGKSGLALDKLGGKEGLLKAGQEQLQKIIDDMKKESSKSLLPGGGGAPGGESKPALPDLKNIFKKK